MPHSSPLLQDLSRRLAGSFSASSSPRLPGSGEDCNDALSARKAGHLHDSRRPSMQLQVQARRQPSLSVGGEGLVVLVAPAAGAACGEGESATGCAGADARELTEADEQSRGEVITLSASVRPSLLLSVGTADLLRSSSTSEPCEPACSPHLSSPDVPVEQAAAEPELIPPTGCAAVVSGALSSLIFTVLYLPFTIAILTQSAMQKRPILPKHWQMELTPRYWLFSFSLFAFLFLFPFVLVYGLMSDSGLWSVFDNDVSAAIPFTVFLALYLALFVLLHTTTLYYAHLRPDLRTVHSRYHQLHLSPSHLLTTTAIVFEAFQLISPWLTVQSLGLHSSSGGGEYKQWLSSSAKVFGVGSWQVVSINTYLETFWTAFSIVLVYAVALGYGIYSNMQPDHWMSGVLFELIPGTLYLSIVARLFSILNCKPNADGVYILQGNASIECWDNAFHRSMVMAAFMGLLFYSSSAMFVACYRGDASGDKKGVKFKPVYLVLERTLRDLFAMTTSLITDDTLSRSLSFPILVVLVSSTWHMQPCSVPALTRLKVLSQGSAVWLLTLTFVADIFRSTTSWFDSYVPALLLYGWMAALAVYIAHELYWWWGRASRKQVRRMSVGMMGIPFPSSHEEDDDDLPAPSASPHATGSGEAAAVPPQPSPASQQEAVAIKVEELAAAALTQSTTDGSPSPACTPRVEGMSADGVGVWNGERSSGSVHGSPVSLREGLNIRAQAMRHCQAAWQAEQVQVGLVPGGVPRKSV